MTAVTAPGMGGFDGGCGLEIEPGDAGGTAHPSCEDASRGSGGLVNNSGREQTTATDCPHLIVDRHEGLDRTDLSCCSTVEIAS